MLKNRNRYVYNLCLAALLVALDIVLARFLSIEIFKGNRIGLQFLAFGLEGWLLGPYWAAAAAVAGDVLGMMINSGGYIFSPMYTIIAILKGLLFGFIFYGKKPSFPRVLIAMLISTVGIDMTLGTYALADIMNTSWLALTKLKLPFRVAAFPVYTLILFSTMTALVRTGVVKHESV